MLYTPQNFMETYMNIDSLRLVLLLSKTLNFTKAADECFMTQPTLSRKILQCEEELGIRIFERSTHTVSLTENGKKIIGDIGRIVSLYDELSDYCHNLGNAKEKPLHIGYTVYPYGLGFCMKVEDYLKNCGDSIEATIDFIQFADSQKALSDGELDGLITIDSMCNEEKIAHVGIAQSKTYAVVNCHNPLSRKDKLSVEDMREEKIILSGKDLSPDLYESRRSFLIENGISSENIINAENAKEAMVMASRNEGIPILNEEGHINTIDTLKPIPLTGEIPEIDFIFAWMQDNKSKNLERYIEAVKAIAFREDE